jgi:hypothetical protein
MRGGADHPPARVDRDMSLAALDRFSRIKAAWAAAFSRFYASAVDNAR